jgi:hypothetical protein
VAVRNSVVVMAWSTRVEGVGREEKLEERLGSEEKKTVAVLVTVTAAGVTVEARKEEQSATVGRGETRVLMTAGWAVVSNVLYSEWDSGGIVPLRQLSRLQLCNAAAVTASWLGK